MSLKLRSNIICLLPRCHLHLNIPPLLCQFTTSSSSHLASSISAPARYSRPILNSSDIHLRQPQSSPVFASAWCRGIPAQASTLVPAFPFPAQPRAFWEPCCSNGGLIAQSPGRRFQRMMPEKNTSGHHAHRRQQAWRPRGHACHRLPEWVEAKKIGWWSVQIRWARPRCFHLLPWRATHWQCAWNSAESRAITGSLQTGKPRRQSNRAPSQRVPRYLGTCRRSS